MARSKLSLDEARRIALAAAGFGKPRPAPVTAGHIARVIRRLGLLQLDFVNVLIPAHYLVLFSRLGPYDRKLFDKVAYRSGKFTEQWGREASLVPIETWPLLRHRRAEHRARPYPFKTYIHENPEHIAWALEEVRSKGPITAADLIRGEKAVSLGHDWFTTVERAILEWHFGTGRLAIHRRDERFTRWYDLAERVIPADLLERAVERADAERELVRTASRAMGVATAKDIADYFRMPAAHVRPRIEELVESGELEKRDVEGWRLQAYLYRDASLPRRVEAATLLSPFDPLVWHRSRVERLFQFDYRIEIFVPPAQRVWGYYVLPFLLGDRLVARVDLRADRKNSVLEVLGAWKEEGAERVRNPLREELRTLAGWLGLELPRGALRVPSDW